MRATLLGTSGDLPIPRPGCGCVQCAEARREPRLQRTRTALHLELGSEVLLYDAGPDVVHQLEREGLPPRIDRVWISHTHGDHCLGLDDVVSLRRGGTSPLPVHAAPHHETRLRDMFPGLVRAGKPRIAFEDGAPGVVLDYEGVRLEGFETGHKAAFPTTGLLLHVRLAGRVRRIACATDMGTLPEASRERLAGVDVLVADGSFCGVPKRNHAGTDAVLRWARELEIGRVAFTHFGHWKATDAEIRERLGPNVGIAYDGVDLLSLLGG